MNTLQFPPTEVTPEEPASAAELAHVAKVAIQHQLAERPYAALGVAVGLGFVAAGGLASPAVWGLAKLGARIALAAATRKLGQVALETAAGR